MPDQGAGFRPFAELAEPILSDPERRARVERIKEEVMAESRHWLHVRAVIAGTLHGSHHFSDGLDCMMNDDVGCAIRNKAETDADNILAALDDAGFIVIEAVR